MKTKERKRKREKERKRKREKKKKRKKESERERLKEYMRLTYCVCSMFAVGAFNTLK